MAVKRIPDGYHSVTPYLSIKGAAEAIEFYKQHLARLSCSVWLRQAVKLGTQKSKSAIHPSC